MAKPEARDSTEGLESGDLQGIELAAYLLGLATGRRSNSHDHETDLVADAFVFASDEIRRLSEVRTLEAEKLDREMKAILAEQDAKKRDMTCPACGLSQPWGTFHKCSVDHQRHLEALERYEASKGKSENAAV